MALEADLIVDRRRLRRKLSVWRVLAFVFLAVALGAIAFAVANPSSFARQSAHIARIKITGFIGEQTANLKLFEEIEKSAATAVLVTIDSPGGATTGGEALYNGLLKLSTKKPTVAVIDGLGASAAYMAAIATDHVVARRTSLVGSIGVLVQFPNVSKLLDSIGVDVEEVKSSPLKAAPNGFDPTSPEALAALGDIVRDSFDWFKGLVKTRRGYDDAALARVADGRVFTGKQALDLKLIDAIGDEETALAWLKDAKKIDTTLPILDWESGGELQQLGLARATLATLAEGLGLNTIGAALRLQPQPALDGLVSVWHPSATN